MIIEDDAVVGQVALVIESTVSFDDEVSLVEQVAVDNDCAIDNKLGIAPEPYGRFQTQIYDIDMVQSSFPLQYPLHYVQSDSSRS